MAGAGSRPDGRLVGLQQHVGPAQPLVSVVMTVRDGDAYLEEAVRSVQAQSYPHWELIVIDDGSSDTSGEIVERFADRDRRIRLLSTPAQGRAAAANHGTALARGELLARLDADDVALPDRLALGVRWIRERGLDLCGGWAMRFGDRTGPWSVPETHEAIARELLVDFPLINSATIARTEVMQANPYDPGYACEDQELWGRLALTHRLGNVPALLVKYRCHSGQTTRREAARIRDDHRLCRHRLFGALFPEAPLRRCTRWTASPSTKPALSWPNWPAPLLCWSGLPGTARRPCVTACWIGGGRSAGGAPP